MTLELKYNRSCLTALYNREKAHIAAKSKEELQLSHENETFPCDFSALLTYIIDKSNNSTSDKATVFKLSELDRLYSERFELFGKDIPDKNLTD